MNTDYNIIIIGGGLAGLTAALHLSSQKLSVLVIEKNSFPNHKVCGEYISNEVLPYLQSLGIMPFDSGAHPIDILSLSTLSGKKVEQKLSLGGFGISRYTLDYLMAEEVKKKAVVKKERVEQIFFNENVFTVKTSEGNSYTSEFVIGAFGKRSNLDKELKRNFVEKKSPWLAVKAHYECDFPDNVVALHHFDGGYCGLSKVENNQVNMCYLANYNSFKKHKNIPEFEKEVLSKNPFLKEFLKYATSVFETPLAISQISFETKKPVENHIFMTGDSAGLIHPLCGNGMAMAVHGAKIISEMLIDYYCDKSISRETLEKRYTQKWKSVFQKRLYTAAILQKILMRPAALSLGVQAAFFIPGALPHIIKRTHGKKIHA
ncbi:MAG: FAD-dependent oxidoreductase [Flavobacteriaceae bacterium]